jgi:hypothetical protein
MSEIPPPEGVSEDDYEAIEAAVMETVRGRWFLREFARRSQVAEMRRMLDAMSRLEEIVVGGRALPALNGVSPQSRLLLQRATEIAARIEDLAQELRFQDVEESLCASLEVQARAVAGLARGGEEGAREADPPTPFALPTLALSGRGGPQAEDLPIRGAHIPDETRALERAAISPPAEPQADPRVAALASLDGLPMMEKLRLFA